MKSPSESEYRGLKEIKSLWAGGQEKAFFEAFNAFQKDGYRPEWIAYWLLQVEHEDQQG